MRGGSGGGYGGYGGGGGGMYDDDDGYYNDMGSQIQVVHMRGLPFKATDEDINSVSMCSEIVKYVKKEDLLTQGGFYQVH